MVPAEWLGWPSYGTLGLAGVGAVVGLCAAGAAVKRRRRIKLETAPCVLTLNLQAKVVSAATPRDKLGVLFGQPAPLQFSELLYALKKAGPDPAVRGVVARTGNGTLSFAQTQELRQAIADFREEAPGKPFVAVAENIGSSRDYYLAAAASRLVMQPAGMLALNGVSFGQLFFRRALDAAGVVPEFEQRHEYKNAPDALLREKYSGAHKEVMVALAGGLAAEVKAAVQQDRGLDAATTDSLMDEGYFGPARALEAGLIDAIGYEMDELPPPKGLTASPAAAPAEEAVAESDEATAAPIRYAGQSPPLAKMAVRRFVQKHRRMEKKAERKAVKAHGYIGVIHCAGTIKSGLSNPRGGDIGATSFVRTLEKAMADEQLKAVVLAVDSPGGSATASELMGRAIQRCRHGANKPVVCYMGGVAASGGYWMAMECDRIVAQPTTITGSIGVVAGKCPRPPGAVKHP